jgi:hypothetical protein
MSAYNNFSNLNSGFATGSIQDQYIDSVSPYTYIIYPESTANSTNLVSNIHNVTQEANQPTWITTANNPTGYALVNQTQWCILFNGSQTTNYQGLPVCVFDTPRTVSLTFSATNFTNPGTITINGWDDQFNAVTENVVSNGTTNNVLVKSFKILQSIYFSAYPWSVISDSNTCTVTGSNIFGLPYMVNNNNSISVINWDGAPVAISSVIDRANIWRQNGLVFNDSTASPSYNDARGTVYLAAQGTLPNGTTQLQVSYYVYGNDTKLNTQLNAYATYQASLLVNSKIVSNYTKNSVYGSAPQIVQTRDNVTGIITMPKLQIQDIYGAQFPADIDFITSYNQMLTL